MQQRLWFAFAIVAGVGLGVQVFWPVDLTDRPETTFDTAPRGHAAVLALLDRFDSSRGRWVSGLEMPPTDATVWWIAPKGACERSRGIAPSASEADGVIGEEDEARTTFEIAVRPWIEEGGTAIVWLSHPPLEEPESEIPEAAGPDDVIEVQVSDASKGSSDPNDSKGEASAEAQPADPEQVRADWEEELAAAQTLIREGEPGECERIAGFDLPPRRLAGLEGGGFPAEGDRSALVFSVARAVARRADPDPAATRTLPGPTLGFFDRAGPATMVGNPAGSEREDPMGNGSTGWRPLWVEGDDLVPIALARSVGAGRLIVVADARIVSNGRLGHGDSAPFVFDWVGDYGEPFIDEHFHGVVPESGTFRYLAHSPAWAAGLGMVVVGLLVIWRGHAWPKRMVSEFDREAPTLGDFVDSLARLYSGTRDHEKVFERYRVVCLDRIRRALGLAPGTPVEILLSSLRRQSRNRPELDDSGLRHLLAKRIPIRSAADLERNAARLDDLVRRVRQGRPTERTVGRKKGAGAARSTPATRVKGNS